MTSTREPEYPQHRFQPPPGATELLLVRHGASQPARADRPFPLCDGHGDPALAPEGERQAELVCARLAAVGFDAVYVTTLRRTAQTAAPLLRARGIEATVEPGLREVGLGEWEGGLFRIKVVENGELAQRMWREERYDVIPGAEPAAAFADRVRAAVTRLAAAHPDQRVVVFTHGGVIGQILAEATGSRGFAFAAADNTSISHLVVADGRWIVRGFNDTAHLDPALRLAPVG